MATENTPSEMRSFRDEEKKPCRAYPLKYEGARSAVEHIPSKLMGLIRRDTDGDKPP
jgi:hypothetical protein